MRQDENQYKAQTNLASLRLNIALFRLLSSESVKKWSSNLISIVNDSIIQKQNLQKMSSYASPLLNSKESCQLT
jgi:hypothetical protein